MGNKKRSPQSGIEPAALGGVASTRETASQKLERLLLDKDAVAKAIDTLVEMLDSTVEYWNKADECMEIEVDGPTRTKASQILLAYAVGDPVKRQQILSGKLPSEPINRGVLRETIDKKIAAIVNRDDVTLAELVQASQMLAKADKEGAEALTPISEAQLVEKARQIHGMGSPDP